MNDKIIINTISKIHFTIVSFFVFIFLALSVIFIVLQNGLYIDNISVPNLKIKKLYIKWDEKINLTIDSLKFMPKPSKKTSFDYKKIDRIIKELILFNNFFEKIIVKEILVNDISASLKYSDKESGFFTASSPSFSVKSLLSSQSDMLNLNIKKFHYFKKKIVIDGNIIFDSKKVSFLASLNININNDAKVKFLSYTEKNRLFYRVNALKNIENTKSIINSFDLPKEVRYWVLDAISISDLSLDSLHGWFQYNKLNEAHKHLYAHVTLNNLLYKYNPKLEGVQTKTTELEFKNGTLYILPKEPYSYGQFLDKSWLKIDFNKREELLTLFLNFNGFVDKNILTVLNAYDIKLPFLQKSGIVDTKLKIDVNLRTIAVNAVGDFFTKQANFNYLGLDIDIYNAQVYLNNYDVKINNMFAKYEDIASAIVDVKLDVKKHNGEIKFKINRTRFKNIALSLKEENAPLLATYVISPKQDIINIQNSQWEFNGEDVYVDALSVPFDLERLSAEIPATLVKIPNLLTAFASGKAEFKTDVIDMKIDLLTFLYSGIKLSQSNAEIGLLYKDKKIAIESSEKIRFNMGDTEAIFEQLSLNLGSDSFHINSGILNIDEFLTTDLQGDYNFKLKNGVLNLNNLHLKDKNLDEIFSNNGTTKLLLKSSDKNLTISSQKLLAEYILTDKEWKLNFNSLSKISKKSKLLRDYNLTDGTISLYKNSNERASINFLANIKYPYKLLVKDNLELEDYTITGRINPKNKKIYFNVNNFLDVNIDDNIRIKTKNIGFNINSMLDFINDRNSSDNKLDKKIILNSKNCYLYVSKNRHIISDTIDLQYADNVTTAQLAYKTADAGFKLENSQFHLYGENFNDKFMENLFALSKFKGGNFAFSINGSTKEYDGTFMVKDTTILKYKVLNNILAFVNTIPSLITFSLPGYDSKGLPVKEAYMNFKAKDDVYTISDINLESTELDIVGHGVANIQANTIDLDLNLKTDLGSAVSKIPLVGYILFGEDSITTSLKVTSPLDNPEVKSELAKEILVAPLNIIKRTFSLPFKLFE